MCAVWYAAMLGTALCAAPIFFDPGYGIFDGQKLHSRECWYHLRIWPYNIAIAITDTVASSKWLVKATHSYYKRNLAVPGKSWCWSADGCVELSPHIFFWLRCTENLYHNYRIQHPMPFSLDILRCICRLVSLLVKLSYVTLVRNIAVDTFIVRLNLISHLSQFCFLRGQCCLHRYCEIFSIIIILFIISSDRMNKSCAW